MSKYLDAIKLSSNLKKRLEKTILGEIQVPNIEIQTQIKELLCSQDGLVSKILVEGAFSAKKHKDTLQNIPFISREFIKLLELNNVFNPNYFPFKHQFETLYITHLMSPFDKPGIVVTAPTGAGKTESFLLPLLKDLVENPRQENETGVRAIILYPMNALVADQNKRLYAYLKGQSKIKMFFYNSETPETERFATSEFSDECFIKTRREARVNPPDIMITNYSMLEYILSRPNDYSLIGNALRTIIIDEAHLYTGTLAAEVSLLLKRVVAKSQKSNNEILYMATTATLSGNEIEKHSFFGKFFNKEKIVSVIGEKEFKEIDQTIDVSNEIESFKEIESLIIKKNEDLFSEFKEFKVFPKILKILSEEYTIGLSVHELMERVAPNMNEQTLLNILTIGAKARENDNELPLLPHKLHLQVRSSQGFSICSNPTCPDSKISNLGKLHHSIYYNCTTCKSPTLNLIKCASCHELFFYGSLNDKDVLQLERFHHTNYKKQGGKILSFTESKLPLYVDKEGKKCSEYAYHNKFYEHTICPKCEGEEFYNLAVSDQFLIPLVAETMLVNMPEIDSESNIFLPARGKRLLTFSDSRSQAARLGPVLTTQHETQLFRKVIMNSLLKNANNAFDADLKLYYETLIHENEAKLRLTNNFTIRTLLMDQINDAKVELSKMIEGLSVSQLIQDMQINPILGEFFDRERMKEQAPEERNQLSYQKNAEAMMESLYTRVVNALISPNPNDINLESIGLISYSFPNLQSIHLSNQFELNFHECIDAIMAAKNEILAMFIYIFRQQRATTSEHPSQQIKDHELDMQGIGQYITYNAKNKNLFSLKVTSRSSIYVFVHKLLTSFNSEITEEKIHKFLEAIYLTFLEAARREDIKWIIRDRIQADNGMVVEAFRLVFYEFLLNIPKTLFLNNVTCSLWANSINRIILDKHSVVDLSIVSQRDLDEHSHFVRYRKMYLEESAELKYGLWAEEHSAQLSPKENRRLQDLFIQGKRNVLSATTTLEVGIDIGGLSGVLMANVPPNKANYIQRSGRAGRRTDGSSIILTYTRNRHFDQNVFRDFTFYLKKPLKKLTISLEKEKLAIRHFHSLLLSKFYEDNLNNKDQLLFDSFKKMGYFVGIYSIPPKVENVHQRFSLEIEENSIANRFIRFLNNYKVTKNDTVVFDEIFKYVEKKVNYQAVTKFFSQRISEVSNEFLRSLKQYFQDWEFAQTAGHKNAVRYSIKQKHAESLIDVFSNAQLLPKYGFPIDLKSLQVISDKNMFKLSRGSFMALAEYVPGSKILAGGRLVESKGLSKHFTGENLDEAFGEKGFAYICDKGHFFTSPYIKIHKCNQAGCKGIVSPGIPFIIPVHGYITAASDRLSYKSQNSEKIGKLEIYSAIHASSDNDMVLDYDDFQIIYKEKALIYGMNQGSKGFGFAICTKCGYAESENFKENNGSNERLPTAFKKHAAIYNETGAGMCMTSSPTVWRNYIMMAKMTTDAIVILPRREFKDMSIAQTLANALQLSGCEELGIDERELNSLVLESEGKFNILIYDNQSGGVGYVYDLCKYRWHDWIEKTKMRLYIDEQHDNECLYGCIKCVVTMNTENPLPRKETLAYLNGEMLVQERNNKKEVVKKEINNEDRLKKFKKNK